MTVGRTDNSSNKENEVQDVGDEDIMHELLLDDIDVVMLMNEDNFEIDTGSRDGLHGVKQEDPVLKLKGREEVAWRPGKDQGP